MRESQSAGAFTRVMLLPILLFGLCTLPLLFSCSGVQGVESLHLFSIDIGRSEDQLDLVQRETLPFKNEINIVVRDGLIYVSDGVAGKIMRFNSYGDLLMLLYDARINPVPVLVSTDPGDGRVANRTARSFEFEGLGDFDVAVSGDLFVQDKVSESDVLIDEETGIYKRFVVRRFSPDGTPKGYIGIGGIGGSPFPFIHEISAGEDEELVVVSRTPSEWLIFAFDDQGEASSTLRITPGDLPLPADANVVSIGTIIPDSRTLYVEADYYNDSAGDVTFVTTQILVVDPVDGVVDAIVRLPKVFSEANTPRSTESSYEVMYELLGAAGELIYCLAPIAEGLYRLLVINVAGATEFLGLISIADREALLRTFHLSADGLLTALVAEPLGAKILAWRFDEIAGERSREAG